MENRNNIRKPNIYICLITGILLFLTRTMPSYTNPWILLQWNVNYENGFIYRGLIGTIVQSFIGCVTSNEMMIIGTILTVFYYLFLCLFMYIVMKNISSQHSFLLLLLFVCQPFITQWYLTSTMFGRLDVVLNILFLICLVLATKLKARVYIPIIIALSIMGMLIHEGYAIYSIPTLCAVVLIISINNNSIRSTASKVIIFLVPCILAFVIIGFCGKPSLSQEAFYDFVSSNILEVKITRNDVYSIYYMPLAEKFSYSLAKFTLDKIIHLAATIILMTPTIYVVISLWKCILSNSNRSKKWVYIVSILFSLSTLAAYLVAVDTMRWLGYIVMNNFVVLLIVCAVDLKLQTKIISKLKALKHIIILACVLSVVLGPTQWMKSYAIVDKVYEIIASMLVM